MVKTYKNNSTNLQVKQEHTFIKKFPPAKVKFQEYYNKPPGTQYTLSTSAAPIIRSTAYQPK